MNTTEKDLSYEGCTLSEGKLFLYKEKMNWKGKGTAGDPIVIDNILGFPPHLTFKKTISHMIIENITIYYLYCSRVENITIRNCVMKGLSLSYCSNVNLISNKIIEFKSKFTRGSFYENNQMSQESLTKLNSKFYDKEKYATKNNTCLLSVLMLGPIGYFLINAIFIELLYWFLFAVLITILFFMIFIYFHIKKRIKSRFHLPANILTNNGPLKDEKEVSDSILGAYTSYQPRGIKKVLPYIIITLFFLILIIIFVALFSSIFK